MSKYEADVVVVGSGNGGMSAAVAAARVGAKVNVLEISGATGGSSSFSGGGLHVWGLKTYEEYVAYTEGLSDPVLGRAFFEAFTQYSPWLVEIGAAVTKSPHIQGPYDLHMGRDVKAPPFAPRCREYFDSMEEIFRAAGGQILVKTKAHRLIIDDAGTVTGVRGREPDGPVEVAAGAVVLACGGFQGNPELRVRYLGPDADLASVLGCPYQQGDGMVMAQTAGAALGGSMSTFSAVWTSAFPAVNPAEDRELYESLPYTLEGRVGLSDYTETFEPLGSILVNLDGHRYVDESLRSYRVAQATIKQRRAMGVWVGDQKMWGPWLDEPTIFTGKTPREQFALMAETGGVLVQADTLESLAGQLAGLEANRVHRTNLLRTISGYNEAVAVGHGTELDVPRSPGRNVLKAEIPALPLDEPPFYAWPVRPAIYMCYGGVRINEHAQALDSHGEPVRGLYAVPPTAGGVYREVYVGSISCAGAFGWLAGRHAVAAMSVA